MDAAVTGSKKAITFVVMMAALMALIDITIVNVALPDIATSFGASISGLQWVIDAYTLAPGAESPFNVDVPGVNDVGRYRVSFKTGNRVVPHVDRRKLGAVQRSNR